LFREYVYIYINTLHEGDEDDDDDDDNYNNNKFNEGTSDIGTINSNNRIAAKMYSLWTLFREYMYKYTT
jgi:hypothetical protein